MPEWLLTKDTYNPLKDRDAFIDKSILSILGILTRFRSQTSYKDSKLEVNAVLKLISTFIIILLVSLTKNFSFVITINVFLLFVVSLLDAKTIKYILKLGILAASFTFIIMLPSLFFKYGNNALFICLKVLASVTMVNISASTTQWNDMVGSLKAIFVPDIFIFVLDITIKYIIILGEFALNALYALKLRSIGKSNNKNASLSGVIGTLFIRSKEMSEEMYGAMECRGFNGEYKIYRNSKFKIQDYIFIIMNIIVIIIYFYLK